MFKDIKTKSDFDNLNQKDKKIFLNILAGACVKQKEKNNQIVDYYDYEVLEKFGLEKEDITLPKLATKSIDLDSKIKDLQESKRQKINQLCEKAIISGFASSALGTVHTYQSDRDDQTNLVGLVVANSDDLLKCVDGAGVTEWKPHTAIQLKKVFEDGKQHKKDQLIKATSLKNLVAKATTVDDINQITWE